MSETAPNPIKNHADSPSAVAIDTPGDSTPSTPSPPNTAAVQPTEEEKAYKEELEKRVERQRYFVESIVGTSAFDTRVTSETFAYFYHEPRPTFVFGTEFARSRELTDDELGFANGHEGGHLLQYMEDPETYKRVFSMIKEKAGNDPRLQKVWKRFFNIMLDINDNARVIQRSGAFQPTNHLGNVPTQFYERKLFPTSEFTEGPLCAQYMDAAIRQLMVPDIPVTTGPEVAQVLESPIQFFGQNYDTMYKFMRQRLYNPSTSMKEWMFYVREVVMPQFEGFLQQDIDNDTPLEMPSPDMDIDGGLDPTDADSFKDLDKYLEDKNKSGDQRADEQRKNDFEGKMSSQGYSEDEIKTMWERELRTDEVAQDMKEFWWELVQREMDYQPATYAGFKTGIRPNIPLIQSQIATILTNPSQAAVMERDIEEPTEEVIRPKKLTVVLLEDVSGSMFPDKIEAVRDVKYATGKSLMLFTEEAQLQNPDFPMEINFIVIDYGSNAVTIFNRKIAEDPAGAQKELWEKIVVKFGQGKDANESLGGTQDERGLELALEELEKLGVLDDEEGLVLLTEVTDGDTAHEDESIRLKKKLESRKVRCKAIQIGEGGRDVPLDPNKPEDLELLKNPPPPTGTFGRIWGKDGQKLRDFTKLKELWKSLFADTIREVQEQQ